eukprot:gene17911-biopygen31218
MLKAFCAIFNAFYLQGTNLSLALHLLLCMLPKSDDLTNEKRRRPIGVASLFRKWLSLTINRRQHSLATRYKLIHPTAFGFMAEVDVFDVVYPLNALRDWAHITNHPLFILWLDQFKAYDMINWGGLFAYLNFCGMDLLVRFYWVVFTQTSWTFLTGHGLTRPFTPHNGGTQGCPTTCTLYVMYVTPLLNRLD